MNDQKIIRRMYYKQTGQKVDSTKTVIVLQNEKYNIFQNLLHFGVALCL